MDKIIQFPRPQVVDVTDWPINHIRKYCKDNAWKGFTMRRHGKGRIEIKRTYR